MEPRRSSRLKTKAESVAAVLAPKDVPKPRSPSRKRAKKATQALPQPVGQRSVKYRGGRRSKLAGITELPFDVLFEIFGHLSPLDLLNLARSTKTLRKILMARSAAFVWKDTLARYPDELPTCAEGLSEPKFTHLLFGHYCDYCGSPHGQDVLWAYFLRLCGHCTTENFIKIYSNHSAYKDKMVPHTRLYGARGGIWGSDFMSKSELDIITTTRNQLTGEALKEYENECLEHTKRRLQFDECCVRWYRERKRNKDCEIAEVRRQRKADIHARLETLGWKEELTQISLGFTRQWRQLWETHPFIISPKPLTDRVWEDIKPTLVEVLAAYKDERSRHQRLQVLRKRVSLLEQIFMTFRQAQLMDEAFFLYAPDMANIQVFRDILFSPSSDDVTLGDLMPLTAQFPKFVLDLLESRSKLLLEMLPSLKRKQRSGVDKAPLRLATTFFSCASCQEPISFPRVLEHNCLLHRDRPWDVFAMEDELVSAFTGRTPWIYHADRLSFDAEASGSARAIVKACGEDPAKMTAAAIDELDPRIECLLCAHPKRGRLVMRWKIAVLHDLKEHIANINGSHWRLVPESDLAAVEVQEAKSIAKSRKQTDYRCKRCSHTFLYEEGRQAHLNDWHKGDSLKDLFLPVYDIPMRQPPYAVRIH